ncbi:hypothetical protein PIROE2DRAFT_58679 [Piromyces sp. E2]|nr:hypothetical protein PIROE2DRAFT_58679 [Piromyces sp. E2]|eukprot:OUM67532.1 hypothetical protein PIROE2DRAFT_58679 [Piromyces sp. E2]
MNSCINNINNLELDLISNTFTKNSAINGGVLYINSASNDKNIKSDINILENTFSENSAEYFGGAIYSDYSMLNFSEIKDNEISFNKAGVMGGGMFISKIFNDNKSKIKNMNFSNNTVDSFLNNYSSKPSYITLNTSVLDETSFNITSGEHIPLEFYLYDEYDNIIEDVTKYYSSINLKITIENENINIFEDDDITNSNYNIIGNIGSFIKGKCELNKFRIYALPGTYIIKVNIDNYNEDIQLKFDDIELTISECRENQIKMYDKNGIVYCSDPVCRENCPIPEAAICVAGHSENINNIESNICTCLPGLEGELCDNKIFIDFRKLVFLNANSKLHLLNDN